MRAWRVLGASTFAFTICFAVWMMFAILGIPLKKQLHLTDSEFGLFAAMPVLITEHMTAKLVEQMRKPAAPSAPSAPRTSGDTLTARERDIVRELARGASNKEIARTLDLAESTVKIHVRNILRKLNLTSRVQVAVYAVGQEGMADGMGEPREG